MRDSALDGGVIAGSLQQLGGWCIEMLSKRASKQALAESKQFKSADIDVTEPSDEALQPPETMTAVTAVKPNSGAVNGTSFFFHNLSAAVSASWECCLAAQPFLAQAVIAYGGQTVL